MISLRLLAACAAVFPLAQGLQAGDPPLTFNEVASEVGLVASSKPQPFWIGPQHWMTGGLAVGDFNRDKHPDVFVLGGGREPDRLFLNDGDGTFTEASAAWGVDKWHGGSGVAAADYDDDGWVDLYVTSFGDRANAAPAQNKLYRNTGSGTFKDVAHEAGVAATSLNVPLPVLR